MKKLSVPVLYNPEQHTALAAEAARSVHGGIEVFAGMILKNLAGMLASPVAIERRFGFEALSMLGVIKETTFDYESADFPARLKSLRTTSGMSIPDLARAAGLSDDAIRSYEYGRRSPSWEAVQKIAKALGVPTDAFRTGDY